MAHEDHDNNKKKYSNKNEANVNGSKSYGKMILQKKAPKRGLGVAKLEKLRFEEQRLKKAGGVLSLNPNNNNNSSCLGLIKPTISLSSSCSLFRTSSSNPFTVGLLHSDSNSSLFSKQLNGSGGGGASGGVGLSAIVSGSSNYSNGFSIPNDLRLNHGSKPFFPGLSAFALDDDQFHSSSSSSSSSMMNFSKGISSSSGLKWPSIQNFNGSKYTSFWSDKEKVDDPSSQSMINGNKYPPLWPYNDKIIGMKRTNPFSMEAPSTLSCNNKSIIISEVPNRSIISSQPTREEVKESRENFLRTGQSDGRFGQVSSTLGHEGEGGAVNFGGQKGSNSIEDGVQETRPRKFIRTNFYGFLDQTLATDQNATMGINCSEENVLDLTLKL